MIVSAIVAMGKNREIGLNNQLLWRLPADLKMFKERTLGHALIMGRKTYESIGRPLPGRTTLVVSRSTTSSDYPEGVEAFKSLEACLKYGEEQGFSEVFVCGGGEIYQSSVKCLEKLYLSQVDYEGKADTYFPQLEQSEWKRGEAEFFEKNEKNLLDFSFSIWERSQ
jgi:dihydrofolate reductase